MAESHLDFIGRQIKQSARIVAVRKSTLKGTAP